MRVSALLKLFAVAVAATSVALIAHFGTGGDHQALLVAAIVPIPAVFFTVAAASTWVHELDRSDPRFLWLLIRWAAAGPDSVYQPSAFRIPQCPIVRATVLCGWHDWPHPPAEVWEATVRLRQNPDAVKLFASSTPHPGGDRTALPVVAAAAFDAADSEVLRVAAAFAGDAPKARSVFENLELAQLVLTTTG